MPLPADPSLLTRAEIDLQNLEEIRTRVSPVDRLKADIQGATDAVLSAAAVRPAPMSAAMASEGPEAPAIVVPSAPPPVPSTSPAPGEQAPPVAPYDTPRVQDRINRLYAQKKTAEEEAASLRQLLIDQNAKLDALASGRAIAPPQSPPSFMQDPTPGPSQVGVTPAGFVSRAELDAALRAQRQAFLDHQAIRDAQFVARAEAEREFPDVFRDANARQVYDQILSSERTFASDPMGPVKAAAMARGLIGGAASARSAQAASADARKTQIAGSGYSAPVGSPSNPGDQEARYQAALARARATQDPRDFVMARAIAEGRA